MKNVQSSQRGETHNQYRNRVGRTSRHQHMMSQKSDRSERREEIKRYSEASERIEKKVQREIEETRQKAPSVRDRQIAYDKARGAYQNRPVISLSLVTGPPAHDIHDAMEEPA